MEKYDVVVVGASCGGNKTAQVLAENGKKVLLLEKKEEIGYKVCAGGMTRKCLELSNVPNALIQRDFSRVLLKTPHQTTDIEMEAPFLFTIDRGDMHRFMAGESQKLGVEIRTGSAVTEIKDASVIVNNKEEIGFDFLVGADGSTSIVRRHLGLGSDKVLSAFQYIVPERFEDLEIIFDYDRFGPAYAWIFPYKDTTSIGTGADLSRAGQRFKTVADVRKNFDRWCRQLFDVKRARLEAWTINYDYQGFHFGNKFLIGDAGGFASGLTGEGMYFSMLSGLDVANKILDPGYRTVNIEHMLAVKKREDLVLRSFEINKYLTKLEIEEIAFLLKSRWFAGRVMDSLD